MIWVIDETLPTEQLDAILAAANANLTFGLNVVTLTNWCAALRAVLPDHATGWPVLNHIATHGAGEKE
jgi:hypothetical protein